MMRLKILIILVILGIVFIVFLTVKKEKKIERKSEVSSTESSGFNKFHLIETKDGKPQWELFGQKASVSKAKIEIEEIKCSFFSSEQNVPILMVEAKIGTLDSETRDIELKGQVKATTQEGIEFISQTINWRAKSEIFITPGEVKVIDKKVTMSGYGLEIDPEREIVKIKEQVKIIISNRSVR